ncbi:hypothetical protein [Xanthomonas pisi]|uniref:Cytochrome C n=1 Tax=Xanthomonas pisi TaxID=56457 RepID=A0A2S7D6J9_9XANT|nr:hypothetical protein [Xanthomonas pisi]KLD71484.1 hypothetical protein Y887_06055 [Xanthomonas pisi DSM 18956]PPU69354.1 hypothetical protein XpiCFBP4643_04185 [Xanthomonas pisi]
MSATPPNQSRAARYAFMLVLGVLIGLITTVMVARALQARRDPLPDSLMQVLDYQLRALQPPPGEACVPAQQQARLQSLRLLADELEPAFAQTGEDRRFGEHAQALRVALAQAQAQRSAPSSCAAFVPIKRQISETCQACHRDFR